MSLSGKDAWQNWYHQEQAISIDMPPDQRVNKAEDLAPMAPLAFSFTWISVNDELPGVKIRTHGRQTNCQKVIKIQDYFIMFC